MLRKVPLVVILGSTGTGKTKLSIELARRFGGEIISADSMQVYKGLDIVTAKATKEEQAAAPHHLLDIAVPGQLFTVVNFRDAALPTIDDLLARSKLPVVVGGTNYYIESLLWKVLVTSDPDYMNARWQIDESGNNSKKKIKSEKICTETTSKADKNELLSDDTSDDSGDEKSANDNKSTADKKECASSVIKQVDLNDLLKMTALQMASVESMELHKHLQTVDPVTANRLHPNNRRKVIRALEVFAQTGKTLTEIYEEQRSEEGGSNYGGPLRYPNVIMFWLQCDQDILNARLDKRVDGMVEAGLLTEIRTFYDQFIQLTDCQDYTKGILQTIGFKEFIPYLEKYDKHEDDRITEFLHNKSTSNSKPPASLQILNACLQELKLVTRRYSKKQIKWVRNRLLSHTSRNVPPIYGLDTSHPEKWDELVYTPAANILESFIEAKDCEYQPLSKLQNPRKDMNEETNHYCEICDRLFIGDFQWQIHLKGNRHKKMLSSKKRKHEETK